MFILSDSSQSMQFIEFLKIVFLQNIKLVYTDDLLNLISMRSLQSFIQEVDLTDKDCII